ncbi:MAG TPA: methyltransferase [Euzebyales bacterium]
MSADADPWAALAPAFVDRHYATARGRTRTRVIDAHLRWHLPEPPAPLVDIGGGAGTQSLPLARRGHPVTIVDPSEAMLGRARAALAREPGAVAARVELIRATGVDAVELLGAGRYAGVLCHGVISYVDDPAPFVAALCALVRPAGVVSILAKNAATMAVRPAFEGRWRDALRSFDARGEINALGVATRGDTVDGIAALMAAHEVRMIDWYGVRVFVEAWPGDSEIPGDIDDIVAVELEASRREPYRRLSRLFHVLGRRSG